MALIKPQYYKSSTFGMGNSTDSTFITGEQPIMIHTFMPHTGNFSKIDSAFRFKQYGVVGFQSETYTQRFFPKGRYYKNIREHDQHCTCPFTREIIWDPEITRTILQSGEALSKKRQNRSNQI